MRDKVSVYSVERSVSLTRIERGDRLKQAKSEADAEIAAYRKQLEDAFQLNGTDVRYYWLL